MLDSLTQVWIYLSCTFAFGVALGWLVWGFGYAKELKQLSSESAFWQDNLEQNRRQHQEDLFKIDRLTEERQNLKRRLAAMAK